MPLYSASPSEIIRLAKPGTPTYLFGHFTDVGSPTRFLINQISGVGHTATVAGIITEGGLPKVGDLITIQGSKFSHFDVVAAEITAVNINPRTGIGSISFRYVPEEVPYEVRFPITTVVVDLAGEVFIETENWQLPNHGERITIRGITNTRIRNLNGQSRTIENSVPVGNHQHAQVINRLTDIPHETTFPITQVHGVSTTNVEFSVVNDLTLGEVVTFRQLSRVPQLNGQTRTIGLLAISAGSASRTATHVTAYLTGHGVSGTHPETGSIAVNRILHQQKPWLMFRIPLQEVLADIGTYQNPGGYLSVTREHEDVAPRPSPALAIIPRSPVLEKIRAGDKSIAVAIDDCPEGKSIQNFSIDLSFRDEVPERFELEVEGSSVNRDRDYRRIGEISHERPRFESKVSATVTFVRLHVPMNGDERSEPNGGLELAARLLLR